LLFAGRIRATGRFYNQNWFGFGNVWSLQVLVLDFASASTWCSRAQQTIERVKRARKTHKDTDNFLSR
jgi:hypothetical protein